MLTGTAFTGRDVDEINDRGQGLVTVCAGSIT